MGGRLDIDPRALTAQQVGDDGRWLMPWHALSDVVLSRCITHMGHRSDARQDSRVVTQI